MGVCKNMFSLIIFYKYLLYLHFWISYINHNLNNIQLVLVYISKYFFESISYFYILYI